MLDFFRRLSSGDESPAGREPDGAPPREISLDGLHRFPIADHMKLHNGFPVVDWPSVERWIGDTVPKNKRAAAREVGERAWLQHFRHALGAPFRIDEGRTALLLSSLERNVAQATLEYMERTLRRIGAVLQGIAQAPEGGKAVLIVLDDEGQYYEYVSHYYPESGEFAFSGGMHIALGFSHFVTIKSDLRQIEPVIAHEMTHGCLAHLPIPAWLNEGIAVNTEHRLAGAGQPLYTPEQMRRKHQRYWGEAEIQEFWSGKSYLRTDDGNMLSYDLARILVEQFAKDWERFRDFVIAANRADAGASAARKHLGLSLGATVLALLEREPGSGWEPNPRTWDGEAEKGGF